MAQTKTNPNKTQVAFATANTARDGTGTLGILVAGHANGGVVQRITLKATATTTAGMLRIFSLIGAVYTLIKEVQVEAATPSATVETFGAQVVFDPPYILAANESIKIGTHNAESFHGTSEWGNF